MCVITCFTIFFVSCVWIGTSGMVAYPIDSTLESLSNVLTQAIESNANETLGGQRLREFFQRDLDLRARLPDVADRFASLCSRRVDQYGTTEIVGAIAAVRREFAFNDADQYELESATSRRVNHHGTDGRVDSYLNFLEESETCEAIATAVCFRLCTQSALARVMLRSHSRGFHHDSRTKEDHDAAVAFYGFALRRSVHDTSDACVLTNFLGTFGAQKNLDAIALHEALEHELALWGITESGQSDELDEL